MEIKYYGDKITHHIAKTPEGFLICQDVPISRTGYQTYLSGEMFEDPANSRRAIPVYRPASEVFDIKSLASFEGKPVTNEHPEEDVTPENYATYACGHVQNVHAGTGSDSNKVLADLYITDPKLIYLIQHGKREISCGYYAEERRDASGRICQTRIRGNHVAVVKNGRAGKNVCIRDKRPNFLGMESNMRKRRSYFLDDELLDEEIVGDDDIMDDDVLDDDLVGDDDVLDDDIMDDDFSDDEVLDDDIMDDEFSDDDLVGDDDFSDDDFSDDDFSDDDFADDELMDEDVLDDDFSDDDFADDELMGDDDYSDDEEEINAGVKEVLQDARMVIRDAKRQMRMARRKLRKMRDAVILNDDDLTDEDVCDDDLIQTDADLSDEDYADDEFSDDDFSDDDLMGDDDFADDELMDEDIADGDTCDDDVCDDDLVDEEITDEDLADDDEEVEAVASETIDPNNASALREITEASKSISDPVERKQLQDAIYKAFCKKSQMPGLMKITKNYKKNKMDSVPKGKVSVAQQQSIYDSFNPHKKNSF